MQVIRNISKKVFVKFGNETLVGREQFAMLIDGVVAFTKPVTKSKVMGQPCGYALLKDLNTGIGVHFLGFNENASVVSGLIPGTHVFAKGTITYGKNGTDVFTLESFIHPDDFAVQETGEEQTDGVPEFSSVPVAA